MGSLKENCSEMARLAPLLLLVFGFLLMLLWIELSDIFTPPPPRPVFLLRTSLELNGECDPHEPVASLSVFSENPIIPSISLLLVNMGNRFGQEKHGNYQEGWTKI